MSRKLFFLINPISGTRNKGTLEQLIRTHTEAAGFEFEIHPSIASGDYSAYISRISDNGFTDIVVAGGDGTLNAAIQSLRHLELPFGIIPCGSGNGLAFSASIAKDPVRALQVIFGGNALPTDGFMVNERFACMLCGLGLDAQVAHDFAADPKRGLVTYVRKTIADFISAGTYPFHLKVNGTELNLHAYFVCIANSNQFGNHFTIAPRASLNDGLLDIVVMTRQNKLGVLLHTLRQVSGYNRLRQVEMVSSRDSVLYFQTDALSIRNEGGALMHIDGDPVPSQTGINIRILKNCFRLIYP